MSLFMVQCVDRDSVAWRV